MSHSPQAISLLGLIGHSNPQSNSEISSRDPESREEPSCLLHLTRTIYLFLVALGPETRAEC